MGVTRLAKIVETARHFTIICLKRKIPPLSIVLDFDQGLYILSV